LTPIRTSRREARSAMIAHGPDHPSPLSVATPDLVGIARLIERYAADQKDLFAFEVSQLLGAVAYAVDQDEPYDREEIEGNCHRVAYAWLLTRLPSDNAR
jgi:hypothetical protein